MHNENSVLALVRYHAVELSYADPFSIIIRISLRLLSETDATMKFIKFSKDLKRILKCYTSELASGHLRSLISQM